MSIYFLITKSKLFDVVALSIAVIMLTGCPVYDPRYSGGGLTIVNATDKRVYVCLSCQDSLPFYPDLIPYSFWGNATDEYGNLRTDTIFPEYQVPKGKVRFIAFYGSKKRSTSNCSDKKWRIFLISDKIMRQKTWNEISTNNLYIKKVTLSEKELKEIEWQIIID